jgi:hypothetical protein
MLKPSLRSLKTTVGLKAALRRFFDNIVSRVRGLLALFYSTGFLAVLYPTLFLASQLIIGVYQGLIDAYYSMAILAL